MFFVFKKNQVILFTALVLLLAVAFSVSARKKPTEEDICRSFLEELGYITDPSSATVSECLIPEGFGSVYESYRELNLQAGFDLTPLRGHYVTRYCFKLADEEELYANILIKDKKICGGDICSYRLNGRMIPLVAKEKDHAY